MIEDEDEDDDEDENGRAGTAAEIGHGHESGSCLKRRVKGNCERLAVSN